ncbi:hypothetical protein VTL71DRAFT_7189 [Oculimacula yallundae]|uniref:2EXR domain-containing protein n=1 Tax=Oculimacula yallundae TaxID=86028 RepID=A0ABR4BW33_9HELO
MPQFPLADTCNEEKVSRRFTYFNVLPGELRMKILKYALPRPRVIEFDTCASSKGYLAGYKPPALLSVCRESRYSLQQSLFRCFTTAEHPHGIYVNPVKDYILLRERSCISNIECDKCINRGPFGRYGHIDLIQNIIMWNYAARAENKGLADYDYGDYYFRIFTEFPSLRQLLSCMYCENWQAYFYGRHRVEGIIFERLDNARAEHPEEMESVKSPKIYAIRNCELKYMNWIDPHGELEYHDLIQGPSRVVAMGESEQSSCFIEWRSAVEEMLSELPEEEIGACLQDFLRLTKDSQLENLQKFFHAGQTGGRSEQEQYL